MFKNLGNLAGMASMMGSLQQLPEKLRSLNDRMKSEIVSATSGDGAVTVTMTGTGQLQSVAIADGLSGVELEQSILEATNAAGAAAKQLYADSVSQMASDMNLHVPGLDGVLTSLTGGR